MGLGLPAQAASCLLDACRGGEFGAQGCSGNSGQRLSVPEEMTKEIATALISIKQTWR